MACQGRMPLPFRRTGARSMAEDGIPPLPPHRIAPELAAALARAQGEFQTIRKDRSATVTMKSGGQYRYAFADLATVLEAVRPALAKHELALVQLPTVRQVDCAAFVAIETILAHSSGASIATHLELALSDSTPQAIGSGMTYARRYSVLALLGIAAEDEDDDAEGAQPRAPEQRPARERKGSAEPAKASESQRKMVWARAKERARGFLAEGDADGEKRLAEEIVRAALPDGITSSKEITSRQVDGVLDRIAAWKLEEPN